MKENKNILVFSYYARMPGACQAEWLDDKIDSLVKAGAQITLISATCCQKFTDPAVKHFRVPSISWTDYLDEKKRIEGYGDQPSFMHYAMLPFAFTLGLFLDGLQHLLTGGVGEGRWSWTFSSMFFAVPYVLFNKPSLVLTTGGPASAHLAGIVVSKLIRKPVVAELQDPLSGGDIGRNEQARGWLFRVEKLMVKYSDKLVYVTNEAAVFARKQFKAQNIFAIYPGAKSFDIKYNSKDDKDILRLVHLGSLCATRNFKSIMAAIDLLISRGDLDQNKVKLINLGHVSPEIQNEITQKSYVEILPPVDRKSALEFAANCDASLLIQNNDDRSKVAIPYKTYDYLNLNNKVIGLLNSEELTKLLVNHGQSAIPLNEVDLIASTLQNVLIETSNEGVVTKTIDPVKQALELINV